MTAPDGPAPAWTRALLVAGLLAHDPGGVGLHLRASPGPVRDRFLALLRAVQPDRPVRRCPVGVTPDRLLGGLDLPATLVAGRAVAGRGLLAEADGGMVLLSRPDRLEATLAARLAGVLEAGEVVAECHGVSLRHPARFALVLLDEGGEWGDGEGSGDGGAPAAALLDRMAFRVDLDGLRVADTTVAADAATSRVRPAAGVALPAEMAEALCAAAAVLGIGSARAVLMAARVARAAAALDGRGTVEAADASVAAALVLAHRATRLPAGKAVAETSPEAAPEGGVPQDGAGAGTAEAQAAEAGHPGTGGTAGAADETVLAAAVAALPEGLLDRIIDGGAVRPAGGGARGRGPGRPAAAQRGRVAGTRPGRPGGPVRLDVAETLRAAAPWQRLRQRPGSGAGGAPGRLQIRGEDFRVRRMVATPRATTIFAVDASGSAALHRLAEAKGAVELLLGDCYLRRDQVALLAFRGIGAELLLPPTRALTRARRCLGALPGGGGTPLAAGLDAAADLAAGLRRRGEASLLVVLTDGRANVALDGTADRGRAMADALASAGRLRATGVASLLIDISPRPQPAAAGIAAAMGGRCLALPQADAAALSRAVRAAA